ncbi:MAG: penicillin-binding protein activator [Deltaproteobacteria bacterium]|jgi:branched-chain amino acid transport system substrate-binding protein|nr:penicillin-binding protein activator [Deltaproteobacteria bacterium]
MFPRVLVYPLLFLALAFGTACVSVVSPAPPGPEALLTRADQAYGRGDYAGASSLYSQYLTQAGQTPRREAVLATAGLAAERAGENLAAIRHYETLTASYPNSVYAAQVAPRLPDLYLANDQPAKARELATRLYATSKDPKTKASLKLTESKAFWAEGQYPDALEGFLEARRIGATTVRAQAEEGVGASLYNLTQNQLAEVVRQYGQGYPGPEAAYHLAYQSAASGDAATFKAQAEYFRQYFPTHPYQARLTQLEANFAGARDYPPPGAGYSAKAGLGLNLPTGFQGPNVSPLTGRVTVVALLPLTEDPSSRFAQDILIGLRLALAKNPGQVGLMELDTKGDAGQAARLIAEMAEKPEALAVVGPLTSREALAAAQMAQRLFIPLLAISNRVGLTDGRPFVFRIFLTPRHQAEAVARYALKAGHTSLGALYPDDPYGQAMLGFFSAAARKAGGTLTTVDKYDPKLKNWDEAIKRLTGGQAVRKASTSYQAKTDFTALYLPDSATQVSQILAQLAYHDVTKMTYLGTSMWLTPDLPKAAGRYLTGAVIPAAYASLSQRPETVQFREEFLKTTGREPDQFAAYGYDAGIAIITALNAGATNRGALIKIWPTLTVPGATGPFTFNAEGDYQIEPALLTIEKSTFTLLKEPGPDR